MDDALLEVLLDIRDLLVGKESNVDPKELDKERNMRVL